MFAVLIKKEILDAVRSFRFLIATLLCLILVPVGMYINLKEYEKRLADYEEAEQLYVAHSKGALDAEFPAEGYRPPSPLSVFSIGLEYFIPNQIVTAREGNVRISNAQGVDNPQSLLFGKVDLLFNVSYVISLLALLFAFNTITGEKEEGTLRQIMSNPVPRARILAAKLAGNYLVLLIPFLLSIVISLLIVSMTGVIPLFSAKLFPALILILATTFLFILSLFTLGILVSTLSHRSITAIVVLLLLWTILVLSLPKICPMLAEIIHPVKSQQVFNRQKTIARESIEKEREIRLRTLWGELAPRFNLDPNQVFTGGRSEAQRNLLASYDTAKAVIDRQYNERVAATQRHLEDEYQNDRQQQARIALDLSRLSPASCYTYVISALSGSGTIELTTLRENADRFQQQVSDNIYSKIIVKQYLGTHGSAWSTEYAPGFDPSKADVPELTYQPTGFSDALRSEWLDIVLLALYAGIFFVGSYVSFLRYDVR